MPKNTGLIPTSGRNRGELSLSLHPKQGEALNTLATELLYGGSAGGGKSHLMRVAAIIWSANIPGLQVYLFRRIREDLVKNHMEGPKGFRAMLAPWAAVGFVTIVEDEIRFWNGSKIYLCHCKDEKDIYKYQGAEIHVLIIDELTHFSESMYRFLRNRVRMVGVNVREDWARAFPRIVCGANPGNIGHLWVKATFIDGAQPMELRKMGAMDGGMLRQFIPARLDDNPSMATDDQGYEQRLEGLGSHTLVQAMRWGDWNVVEGAFFDCWDSGKHVIRPIEVPAHWMRFGSFDWGSAKPFSMGWWAVSDGSLLPDGRHYPTGAMIRYREWYGASAPNVGLKMIVEDIADGIRQREKGENISYRVADPACWKVDGGPSHFERFMKKGVLFRPADNARVAGWDQLRARMQGDDAPMIYWFSTCLDSIRTIPALQHDEHKPEDIDSDGEDHAGDDTRYAVMSRPYTRKIPGSQPIRGTNEMTMNEAWKMASPKRNRDGRI